MQRRENKNEENKKRCISIKIVTCNVPESYIEAINKLIGEGGLFPSRSELVRVATREFLLKELRMAKNLQKFNEPELEEVFDDKNFVRVPIEKHDENNEPVRGFKTFKIIQRLE
ncbi:MAG: ribbon-helix-helix domain-containing protein [Nanoarchaeota archaeon]|nr:ribbon-helix-helix domain-containing protein [Nanoarchaeota archaeon]